MAAAYWKVPTRRWLLATRASTAPGSGVSRCTGRPVATTASARVVGMPSACIASLTMYSRSIGPTAARPSPPRANGVAPEPLRWRSRRPPPVVDEFAEQQRPAVAQAGNVAAELVSGVCLRHRRRPIGDQVADEQSQPVRPAQPRGVEAEFGGQRLVEDEQTRVGGGVGLPPDGQLRQFAREAVAQGDGRIGCNAHATQTTERPQVGSVW